MGHLISAVLGSSLAGVLVGAWLAAQWQRRYWILDNKKSEYREILLALDAFWWKVCDHTSLYHGEKPFTDFDGKDAKFASAQAIMAALSSVMGTLTSSVFVRKSVLKSGVIRDLQDFYHSWEGEAPPDYSRVSKGVAKIKFKVLQSAWRDLKLGGPLPAEPLEMSQLAAKPPAETSAKAPS